MPLERLAPRLVPRFAPRPVSRLVLLACLICVPCGSHRLVVSSARLSLGGLLSSRRLIGSPLARIALAPRPIDKRDGARRKRDRLRASDGGRLLAYHGWRRGVVGGHRRRMAAGVGVGVGCLLASGRWTERLDRSSIVSLFPSSAHPIGSAPAPFIIPSLIISSTGRNLLFPFRPTPSRLLFSACLLWLVPPSPAGGCEGYDMGCGGWRLTGLLASRHAVPLSRCRSFARCYMICVNRAARSCLGCCGAFYGLFCPLSCRRWRF